MSGKLQEAIQKIESFKHFEYNWNGNGAKPFSEQLIRKTTDLLKQLTPTPQVFPTACNSIQLEWESSGSYVELEVFEDKINIFFSKLE